LFLTVPANHYRWVILIFGVLAYTVSYFVRGNYTGIAKFVSADLGLDKGNLGVMGAVFFYSYALAQMPWGVISDRWGGRKAIGTGIFICALTLYGFSASTTYSQLKFWRLTNGVAAAAIYVSMVGILARWFSQKERGLSQSIFAGVGGAAGEAIANVALPFITIYVASDWRASTQVMATLIAAIGLACILFLKSAPPGETATVRNPFDWVMLKDLQLWSFTVIFTGSVIALRIVPIWLPIYAADIYISKGMGLNDAVLAGGLLSTLYLAGRVIGVPAGGLLSDRLINRGISRKSIAIASLVLTVILLQVFLMAGTSTLILGTTAFFLGATINMYPLITSAASERFGPQKTASSMGFINMFSQLCGATALAVSGYMGIALNSAPGNALEEYRGIWLVGVAGCFVAAALGIAFTVADRRRSMGGRPV
jgi:sugar phosphate permease